MLDAIPFEFLAPDAPLVLVTGRIEGDRPITIVVDTGAMPPYALFLSDALAQELALPRDMSFKLEESGAFGPDAIELQRVHIASFSLGSVSLADPPVAASKFIDKLSASIGRRIDGIVGYEFLRTHRFSIDYGARLIDFDAEAGAETRAITFTVEPKSPMIRVRAKVNGYGPVEMELDTAATASFVSPSLAERAGIAVDADANAVGAGGEGRVRSGHADIELGGQAAPSQLVAVSDQVSGRSAETAEGLIGAPFFLGRKVTISYPDGKLWVESSPTPP